MKKGFLTVACFVSASLGLFGQDYPEMVKVKGGSFQMGDEKGLGQDNELPVHQVTLSDFSIARTETTVQQWKMFCQETGRAMPPAPPTGWINDHPIVNIKWQDAADYAAWLTNKTGKKYRLPTEAEWEFAARGGTLSKGFTYSGGDEIDSVAWYAGNAGGKTQPVARKRSNELGLYDMTGNAWEWCKDTYGDYTSAAVTNPTGAATGDAMTFRGGGWYEPDKYSRIAMRGSSDDKGYTFRDLGFRVVCE